MDNNFLKAAASYFGLAETNLRKSGIFTEDDTLVIGFEVRLSDEDMMGILQRMQALTQEAPPEPLYVQAEGPSREELRAEYDGMDARTRSQFGSFLRYESYRLAGGAETVTKVELPPYVYLSPGECTAQQRAMAIGQDEKGNYAVTIEDLTPEQRATYGGALRIDEPADQLVFDVVGPGTITSDGLYTAPPANEHEQRAEVVRVQATADQLRQAYVERTVAAHQRLNGADGKPTSNADDFGGLPG